MKSEDPIHPGAGDEAPYRISYLIAGFIRENLTQAEHQELDDWVTAKEENQVLFEELTDERYLEKWKDWQNNQPANVNAENDAVDNLSQNKHRHSFRGFAIAATLLLAIVLLYLLISQNQQEDIPNNNSLSPIDLSKGIMRAKLTLSDGSTVEMDSTNQEIQLRPVTGLKAKQKDGILIYSLADSPGLQGVDAYHLLTTGRGCQFQVQWTDGSKVWLNAGSSVKYPIQFSGMLRKVLLTGEAYFEIEKNAQMPFIVEAGGTSIRVLGTHFNVQAYAEEKTIRVSLAEGIVKINDGQALLPGELVIIDSTGKVTKSKADLDAELGWKNGLFVFKGSNINEVMLQISRWYDVEFVVNHTVTDHFNAVFPRDKPVSTLLHLLEGTGNVHFTIEGKKIFVK